MEDEVLELAYKKPEPVLKRKSVFEPVDRLCSNYLDNLCAYVSKSKIKDPYTGQELDPDEKLMRSVEECIDVAEQFVDDFRRGIATQIGTMAYKNKQFKWDSNPQLAKALMNKVVKDTHDCSAPKPKPSSVDWDWEAYYS